MKYNITGCSTIDAVLALPRPHPHSILIISQAGPVTIPILQVKKPSAASERAGPRSPSPRPSATSVLQTHRYSLSASPCYVVQENRG